MAEPSSSGWLEELKQEITCVICHECFVDPKLLPCLHYYCRDCVELISAKGQPFSCPECRQETTLPAGGPDKLPTPFFINRMIDLYEKLERADSEGKVEAKCEVCSRAERGLSANGFCRQCACFVCAECAALHRSQEENHTIITLDRLSTRARQLSPVLPSCPFGEGPDELCKEHDKELQFFCFTCVLLVCRDCISLHHRSHDHETAKTAGSYCRKKLEEDLKSLQKAHDDIRDAAYNVTAEKERVSEEHSATTLTIQHSIDHLIEVLLQRKQQLLMEVSRVAAQKTGALAAQVKELHITESETEDMLAFLNQALDGSADEELMKSYHQIHSKVFEACSKFQKVSTTPVAKAEFTVDLSFDESTLEKIGTLYLTTPDVSKCTVEGPGLKDSLEVDKTTHITVSILDSDRQPYSGTVLVEVEVMSLADSTFVYAKVAPTSNGRYRATYTPTSRGVHSLIVRVNHEAIPSSPFEVFAKMPSALMKKPIREVSGVSYPYGLTVTHSGELLVTQLWDSSIAVFDTANDMQPRDSIQCSELRHPVGVTTDKYGNVYVSDKKTLSVLKFSRDGELLKAAKVPGKELGMLKVIGDQLFVCQRGDHEVHILDCEEMGQLKKIGQQGTTSGAFNRPIDITFYKGEFYVSDSGNRRVQVFSLAGHFVRSFELRDSCSKLCTPRGLCVGPDGLLYIACSSPSCVLICSLGGSLIDSFETAENLTSIAVDQNGFVYVTSHEYEGKVYVF